MGFQQPWSQEEEKYWPPLYVPAAMGSARAMLVPICDGASKDAESPSHML